VDSTLAQLQAGKLQGSKQLKLSCGLTTFPSAIYDLVDTLEILDLTDNALSTLPDDLDRFKKLRILFCSSNQFTELPAVLGKCESLRMIGFKANQIRYIPEEAIPTKHLRWFIVTDNRVRKLPDALGDCKHLQKLMLAGNQLSALPQNMANCHALELLRISANQFAELPMWLFDLPKLTWLAYAGNPFSNAIEQTQMQCVKAPKIDWSTLTIGKVLGQGASGITYQANWQHNGSNEPVAVKLFKAGLTSDGLPSCEMDANVMAGEHQNLVGVKGIISNHPEGINGLVMPLLHKDLTVLADPPSFETCSRDVYSAEVRLTSAQANHIAAGVAKAMRHLHQQGLMHGDLYAHNILWNDTQVVLSDLGGASFLPVHNKKLAQDLMQLDERAYQVLIEELASITP
jgi:Protein tyrosine and serine/threonine kinase/Leucine rich repeat